MKRDQFRNARAWRQHLTLRHIPNATLHRDRFDKSAYTLQRCEWVLVMLLFGSACALFSRTCSSLLLLFFFSPPAASEPWRKHWTRVEGESSEFHLSGSNTFSHIISPLPFLFPASLLCCSAFSSSPLISSLLFLSGQHEHSEENSN